MKKLLLLLAVMGAGCDRDFDLFEDEKSAVTLSGGEEGGYLPLRDGVLRDSVKLGQRRTYIIEVSGGSDDNAIAVKAAAGARDIIRFYLNDNVLQGGASLARGQHRVGVEAEAAGGARGSIQITDAYGHLTDIPYDFTAFFNLPPVCRINVTNIKEYSPYEAIIDLSGSYDADAGFGGQIDQYEYRIGSYYRLNTHRPLIYHIFPSAGVWEVRCRARDNNGTWSEFAVISITMEDI